MSYELLSAGEAARVMGVSPITIQRWVDSRILRAYKTSGGHRRVHAGELRKLLDAKLSPAKLADRERWRRELFAGNFRDVAVEMQRERERIGSWSAVCDNIARAVASIGLDWAAGHCSVCEEHVATETLKRAVITVINELFTSKCPSRRALLMTPNGERHTLGLSLAELVLIEGGWKPLWVGEGPPSEELGAFISLQRPELFVVAATGLMRAKELATLQQHLLALARERKASVILAGEGRWKKMRGALKVSSFSELNDHLVKIDSSRQT